MVWVYDKPLSSWLLNIITIIAYNAFAKYGRSSSWCRTHALSFRAMSRAVSIRGQLKKYMQRFSLPIESCQGDAKRLRQCIVSGYWRNGARWVADGTYRSVRGETVCISRVLSDQHWCWSEFLKDPACASQFGAVHAQTSFRVGCVPWNGGDKEDTVCGGVALIAVVIYSFLGLHRIRILTEIEPDW